MHRSVSSASASADFSTAASAFAQDLVAAWNSHSYDRILPFYAPTFTGQDVGSPIPLIGHEGVRQLQDRYCRAFPDLTFRLDEVITQGNRLSLCWTATGTHSGDWMNIPATARPVQVAGVSLLQVADLSNPQRTPRIVSARNIWDVAGVLRALGLLPRL